MRAFSKPMGIDKLSVEAKAVYSFFALFLLIGYATSVWFYLDDDLGTTPSGAKQYYLGSSTSKSPSRGGSASDLRLTLDLPPENPVRENGSGMPFAKPKRQIIETFHFHIFSVPICLLVIGHLFMMCELRRGTKLLVIATGSLSTLIHILTPPLIRFVSPEFALLMFPSAALMTCGWLLMTTVPLWQMWRPQP